MEKQYSTHYLSEKYKQHQFIDIYNFEISFKYTVHRTATKIVGYNGDV